MNTPIAPNIDTISKPIAHLLDGVRAIRASVGDGLNEEEFTRLLQRTLLRTEAGFVFLSFSEGCVTLGVPEQDPTSWYPKNGWINPEKEQVAREIAKKHGLSLYQPVDTAASIWDSQDNSAPLHHHLELTNQLQTVVIAHPHYLKVRLYGKSSDLRYRSDEMYPLKLSPELLGDLSALYQP